MSRRQTLNPVAPAEVPKRPRGRPPTRGAVASLRIEVKVTPEEVARYTAALRDGEPLAGVIRGLLDRWAKRRGLASGATGP